jgi:hypothetical protein
MHRILAIVGLVVLVTVAVPSAVAASSPHQLDPSLMTPPLNPSYGPWICTDTGGGPVCRGELHEQWTNEDSGLTCGSAIVYTTGFHDT